MVQRRQQVTSARLAPTNKNHNHSIGLLLILGLMAALKLQVNCHSHQFHPIRMPPQLEQLQSSPSRQQFASEASSSFASIQPMFSNPMAQPPSRLPGANPASWPTYQAGWSHVLRPSPWLHFAKNLVAAPIAIGASNWAPSARHLSLPTDQQHQAVAVGPQATGSASLPTHRRASSGQSNPALVQLLKPTAADANSRPAMARSSVPAARPRGETRSSRSSQQNWHDGKMLICYYATKQTAPYWPKEGREFVVPVGHFEQAASEFFVANQNQNQPAASQSVQETSAPTEANKLNDEQAAMDSTMSAAGAQLKQRRSIFANNAGGNGGRLVVIVPNLVPASFNQSIGAKSDGGNAATLLASRHTNELGIDRADSLGQMFHLAANNNNRRRTITERNDLPSSNNNGATLAVNSAPANQSIGKQLAPLQSESNSQATTHNNGNPSDNNNNNNNVVFFEHNLHDPNNNRQVGGVGGSGSLANLVIQQQKLGASLTGDRGQPPQSTRTSSTLNPTSRNGGTSLSPTAAPQADGPIQNRNFISDHSPMNSSEQLNQFYYYYNLPTISQVGSGQGWKNSGFSVVAAAPTSGPSSAPSTLGTNRFKSATIPQSIHSGSSQVQQGKSLHVTEANLGELSKPTHTSVSLLGSSVTSGTSVSPSGNPLWPSSPSSSPSPSSSSSSSSFAMPNSATTKPSSSLVFNGQPTERFQASNRPKLVSIAGNSFSLDGQRYLSSAPVDNTESTGPMRLMAPAATSPDLHEASFAESLTLSKTTPAMSSSSSLSPGSGFFSSPIMERPSALTVNQHPIQQTTSKLAEESTLSSANNRNYQQPAEAVKQTSIGLGAGNSLSAALVSSPLSTVFDVFGAASQYLMRLRPSSLISPASFAAFNSIGEYNSHHNNANKGRALNSSSSLSSLVSSFGSSKGHSDQRTSAGNRTTASQSDHKAGGGGGSSLLSRLSLQLGQNQQQRREEICGRTIQTPERRIIGGEGAKYGEFPYQVHIKIAKHQCGGALIDRQSIVTAAHCVYHFITRAPVNKLQIVIGAYDIEDEQYQELPPQYFKVNKVKLHPNFRFSASHPDRYDVAILKLDKPVKYTDNVLPVCLPGKELKYDNMVGTVTGFGKTDPSLSNRYGTRLLQKVDVPIIENSECERWHRTRGIDLKIFPEMMCAGYEDGLKDACVGDSGGPLVVKTPTGSNGSFRWTLAGITSAGFGCAQSRQPGIYHRVSHTVDWILDNLD